MSGRTDGYCYLIIFYNLFAKEAAMKITVSVIKADIGSVGGHIAPSAKLIGTVKSMCRKKGKDFSSTIM